MMVIKVETIYSVILLLKAFDYQIKSYSFEFKKKIVIRLSKASRIYWQVEMKVPLKYTMNKPSSSYQNFHDGWMQEI